MSNASAKGVIRRFTLRRAVNGAIGFGLFAAIESAAQSLGIIAAYPNVAERAKIVYGLASNAALGMFYGDRHADILSPSGYMTYRILPIISLAVAIWTLMFITKMLRGQEENGRWELLLAGQTSARKATAQTVLGAAGGTAITFAITLGVLLLIGQNDKLAFSFGGSLLYSAAIVSGAVVALGVGAITSQLAATRRRAVLYGLIPIVGLFVVRSIGNVVDSLVWIKNLTPFGWIDKMHPYAAHAQPIWLLPIAALALLCCATGIWLSGKRDMAASLVADSGLAKPHFKLLKSQLGFSFRSTRNTLAGWLFMSLAFAAVVAAVDKTVSKSLSSTDSLSKTFSNLSGNASAQLELAYLSAAAYLTVTILMIMVTTGLNAARDEEGSGRLDNFVSGTVGRQAWLRSRLGLLVFAAAIITFLSNLTVWAIAEAQDIHVSATTMLLGGFSSLGPVVFLLGFGALLYGLKPRLATMAMYALIVWSFTVDIVASVVKASHYVSDSSLLHYISLVPAAQPNWRSFSILTVAGVALMGLGIVAFQRRDLEAE